MRSVSRRTAIILHDLCMIFLAWVMAYLARYNFSIPVEDWSGLWRYLPAVMIIQGGILWRSGLYRGLWRFASIPDLWNIIRGTLFGMLGITLVLFLFHRMEGVPRTVLLFYPIFLIIFLGAPRMIYRMWNDHGLFLNYKGSRKRVLILGAGRAGEMLVRDISREGIYQPVGFLDDQKRLQGSKVHGIPVLGKLGHIRRIARDHNIDVVIIAIPSATNIQMQRIVSLCEKASIPFRTLPRMQDLVSGLASISELREVAIDDLLGRDPVLLDWQRIHAGLSGKTVMVSGGGGSIGSELCRQIARLKPSALIVFDNCEYNLYSIEQELKSKFSELPLYPLLGDVTDSIAVAHVFKRFHPEVVFHAAAYKHVPILEPQAREAVRNNISGTRIMAQTADRCGCGTFVLVSTDKAVNPANVMGATKRAAELYCQSLNEQSRTRYITVRFGNVLDSAGSVVPLFRAQIARGGPVTVTHPEIRRYFMTIPEASQLILQAGVLGQGGEIYVLDMGEPVKISYLAEQMIRLSGKVPEQDIRIKYTGLRPGEKLYEELFYDREALTDTGYEKLLLAKSDRQDWQWLSAQISGLEQAVLGYDENEIRSLLTNLVPISDTISVNNNSNIVPLTKAQA